MSDQNSRESGKGESVLEQRDAFQFAMAKIGFVAGTQTVYLRAFDAFAKRLDRKTPASATLKEARRYLTERVLSATVHAFDSRPLID